MTHPLQWARSAVARVDPRGRLADNVALALRAQLPDDHLVLAQHPPRDGREHIPVVIVGRHGLTVIEPRDDEGDLVCYQDRWYRHDASGALHGIGAPSTRARDNALRLRRDLGTGGFINVPIEPVVLLTRGRAEDVRSSCASVFVGIDALVRHVVTIGGDGPTRERINALAQALDHPITLATN